MQTTRLAYTMAQTHSRKTLDESRFELKPASQLFSDEEKRARAEAAAIRSRIQSEVGHGETN